MKDDLQFNEDDKKYVREYKPGDEGFPPRSTIHNIKDDDAPKNNKLSKIVKKSEIADNDYNLSAALYFKEETEIPEIEELIDNQKYLSSKLKALHYDFIHTISRLSQKNE